jgi:polyphenol oxidase
MFKFFGKEYGGVVENLPVLCAELGISPQDVFYAEQTHSKNVYVAKERPPQQKFEDFDAFISNVPGLNFMIKAADCQAISLFDPVLKVIGAVHSGWRGSVQNILGETVSSMNREFCCDPSNILAYVSPSLGPCCGEFSDPSRELPSDFVKYFLPGNRVDFWACSFDQLVAAGILPENIDVSRQCTVCNHDKFFSYRTEGRGHGLNGLIVGL